MSISSEEKKAFLEEIIPLAFDPSQKGIVPRQLYELFLRETTNGKMYKYRSFDRNGYALSNLSTGTLYCSKVTGFNDPFDSKLGLDFNQFSKVILQNNPELQREVLAEAKEFCASIGIAVSMEELGRTGDERSSIQSIAHGLGVKSDKDEIELTMEVAKALNPGYCDKVPHALEMFDEMNQINMEALNRFFGVGCLTTSPKNRLMWSHYAECHRGFCIEYDFNEVKDKILPFPIVYSSDRPQIPWDLFFNSSAERDVYLRAQYAIGLLTKDKAWQYENEWRVLLPATNPPELPVPITGVYLGACIDPMNKEKILKIANENHIPVKQMTIDREKYELHIEEL